MGAYCGVDLQLHIFFTLAVKERSMIISHLKGSFCSQRNLLRHPLDMKLGSLLREIEQAVPTVDQISCSFREEASEIKKLIVFTTAKILERQFLKRF
jgi:hypothetical protein